VLGRWCLKWGFLLWVNVSVECCCDVLCCLVVIIL